MSYHVTAAKSIFVVGIKEGEGALLPFDDFLIAEEAAQLHGCRFWGVGGMHDVFLEAHAIAAADGAGGGMASVGGSCQGTHGGDGVDTLQAERHDGRRHHRVFHALEEGLFAEVGIVFREQFVGEHHHLHAAKVQSFLFKDADDFANEGALQCAGLEQYEGLFNGHNLICLIGFKAM